MDEADVVSFKDGLEFLENNPESINYFTQEARNAVQVSKLR